MSLLSAYVVVTHGMSVIRIDTKELFNLYLKSTVIVIGSKTFANAD